ncbi:hypothetical protein MNBD_UNCLBAC01-597 [hydrothermal vent metagenome]|uniref:Uncharacterized protein n=1 Tax=hydrothermal vent metagenome TaxID=652676 RepID=A0A3B1E5J3_9ZZZZ
MSLSIVLPKFIRKSSPVFKHFLSLDEVVCRGVFNEKIIVFDVKEQNQSGKMLMMSIIRQDEIELWKSAQELLNNIFTSIEQKLQGIFRFELLSIAMNEDWKSFQWGEFSKGICDLAHELSIGESQFVQYCSIFGILTKHAYEDFGKITFNPQVRTFDRAPENLDASLMRLIRESQREQGFKGRSQLIFYDLSREPLYDTQNVKQAAQLSKMDKKLNANAETVLTEVYVIDKNGLHRLFQKMQMELF